MAVVPMRGILRTGLEGAIAVDESQTPSSENHPFCEVESAQLESAQLESAQSRGVAGAIVGGVVSGIIGVAMTLATFLTVMLGNIFSSSPWCLTPLFLGVVMTVGLVVLGIHSGQRVQQCMKVDDWAEAAAALTWGLGGVVAFLAVCYLVIRYLAIS